MLSPVSKLDSPRVIFADCYRSAVVWFVLEDCKGVRAEVCIDRRAGSPTRNRLFDQARHPNKEGAVLLKLGGPEEGIVVPLVSHWLDSGEPHELHLHEFLWKLIREALLQLGESD